MSYQGRFNLINLVLGVGSGTLLAETIDRDM